MAGPSIFEAGMDSKRISALPKNIEYVTKELDINDFSGSLLDLFDPCLPRDDATRVEFLSVLILSHLSDNSQDKISFFDTDLNSAQHVSFTSISSNNYMQTLSSIAQPAALLSTNLIHELLSDQLYLRTESLKRASDILHMRVPFHNRKVLTHT